MDARTCKPGFVWREAYPGDFVCVEPNQRDQAAADNAAAGSRVNPGGAYGPHPVSRGWCGAKPVLATWSAWSPGSARGWRMTTARRRPASRAAQRSSTRPMRVGSGATV
jgi:hypothetical protein